MLPGMVYLVFIHRVPLVPLGPVGKVYGDVAEARKTNVTFKVTWSGKGLTELWGGETATICMYQVVNSHHRPH